MNAKTTLLKRTTGLYLATVLKLMAFTYNRDASLRSHLYRRRDGTEEPFDTRYQFRTVDGTVNLYLIIENGKMRAGSGVAPDPHLVASFCDALAMRAFLSPFAGGDPLNLMIENKLSFEGNMTYLSRLGHLTAMARNRRWRKALQRAASVDFTSRGGSMLAASRTETRKETLRCAATSEVAVLDDAYLSRYTLDDFPRLRTMRAEFFGACGEICTERPRLVTDYYREHGFETDAGGRDIELEPSVEVAQVASE